MQDTFEKMKAACNALAALMVEFGLKMPTATIEAQSGVDSARVSLNWAKPASTFPAEYEFVYGETVEAAVNKAEAWIRRQPTAKDRALQEAVDLTAKALEACKAAALDTKEADTFVSQLEAVVRGLSENAITDQSEAPF